MTTDTERAVTRSQRVRIAAVAGIVLFLVILTGLWVRSYDLVDPGDGDLVITPVASEADSDANACLALMAAEHAPSLADRLEMAGLAHDGVAVFGGLPLDTALRFQKLAWDQARADGVLARIEPARRLVTRAIACPRAAEQSADVCLRDDVELAGAILEFECVTHARAGRIPHALAAANDAVRLGSLLVTTALSTSQCHAGHALREVGLRAMRAVALDPRATADELDGTARGLARSELDGTCVLRTDYTQCVFLIEDRAQGLDDLRQRYSFKPRATRTLLAAAYHQLVAVAPKPFCEQPIARLRAELADAPPRWLITPNREGEKLIRDWSLAARTGFDSALHQTARDRSELRATRIVLALEAHRRRTGALPPSLDVVAGALGGVPADPYDGAPFRYDSARRRVWVVGVDLKDEGGCSIPAGFSGSEDRWAQPDPGWQLP